MPSLEIILENLRCAFSRFFCSSLKNLSLLIFSPFDRTANSPAFFNFMTIPLSTIFKIQLVQSKNIILHTKDTRVYRITLSQPDMFSSKSESLVQTIQQISF
jgi:hypothetical protein